jgi:hypothetical protein
LWNGKDGNSEKSKVAWGEVCLPKKEGSLGLKCFEVWNRSFMMRHIWNLFARSGSLWVAWVQQYLLKGRSLWNVKLPQNASWCWRKILNLRGLARDILKVEVGNGKSIHLWLDNWHPLGPLFDNFGFRPIYDSQSQIDAKLDSVLRNGEWCWKPTRSDELVTIQSRLPEVRLGVADKPIWTIAHKGTFVSSDTWNHLRLKRQLVD